MALIKTFALVLKSIEWKDTSKIVTLLTRELGRVDVIVKGAKLKAKSSSGIIQSLNLIEALVYFSKGRELQILGNTSLENSFAGIRTDLERTSYALSIIELIIIFFKQGHTDQIFFDFLITIISQIEKTDNPLILLLYFLLKLSSYLGFRPEFMKCRKCGIEIKQISVFFNFREGSVICNNCDTPDDQRIKLTRVDQEYLLLLQNTGYKSVSRLNSPKNKKFSYLNFLMSYLNYHTEQPIQLKALKLISKSINSYNI